MTQLKTAFVHIRRTPYQALAAVTLTSLSFFIVTLLVLVNLGLNQVLHYFESKPQVIAFFQNNTTQEEIQNLQHKIQATGVVKDITYISQEQALNLYRQQNQDNPLLLEITTPEMFPASLEVSTYRLEDLEKVVALMRQEPKVEDIAYQQDVIQFLQKWTQGLRLGGLAVAGIFLFVSLVTITVIIGLKIAARKEEINLLSLLGATSWYIKAPFILEGIIYGLLGSLFGWGLTYLGLLYLTPNLTSFFQDIPLLPVPLMTMLQVLGLQLFLGTLLGWLSALIAARRYGK